VASGAAVVRAPGRERPPIEGREKRSIDKKYYLHRFREDCGLIGALQGSGNLS